MKIYEALEQMIEHGNTIRGGNYLYKIGKADWEDTIVLLSKFYNQTKWEVQGSFHTSEKEFIGEWEVVEEAEERISVCISGSSECSSTTLDPNLSFTNEVKDEK